MCLCNPCLYGHPGWTSVLHLFCGIVLDVRPIKVHEGFTVVRVCVVMFNSGISSCKGHRREDKILKIVTGFGVFE